MRETETGRKVICRAFYKRDLRATLIIRNSSSFTAEILKKTEAENRTRIRTRYWAYLLNYSQDHICDRNFPTSTVYKHVLCNFALQHQLAGINEAYSLFCASR